MLGLLEVLELLISRFLIASNSSSISSKVLLFSLDLYSSLYSRSSLIRTSLVFITLFKVGIYTRKLLEDSNPTNIPLLALIANLPTLFSLGIRV